MTPSAVLRGEALRFLAVGAVAAGANFGSRILFSRIVTYEIAIVLAFLVGLGSAFILNRVFVFVRPRPSAWVGEAIRFTMVNLAGLAVTLGVSLWSKNTLLPVLGVHRSVEEIAHLGGIAATVVTSYVAHKLWTFRT